MSQAAVPEIPRSKIIKASSHTKMSVANDDVMGRFDPASAQMLRNPAGAAEGARRAGYDQGYAEGLAQARQDVVSATEDANKRVRRALAALSQAVDQFDQRQTVALADVEDAIVAGAFALARTILQRELIAAHDPGGDALARALQLLPDRCEVLARLHPDDAATLNMDRLQSTTHSVALVADSSIELGGCIVEVGPMRIDAQLSTALRNARQAMEADPSLTDPSMQLVTEEIQNARHDAALAASVALDAPEALEAPEAIDQPVASGKKAAKGSATKKATAGSSRKSSRKTASEAPLS